MRLLTGVVALVFVAVAVFSTAQPSRVPGAALAVAVVGVVVDETGAGAAGATVELRAGALVRAATTNSRGEFRFDRVAEGLHEVRAMREGFAPVSVRVAVGREAPPPLRLWVGVPLTRGVADVANTAQRPSGVVGGIAGGVAIAPVPAMAPPHVRGVAAEAAIVGRAPSFNREGYGKIDDNPFRRVGDEPLSTLAIDVDTASYANVRRFLNEGRLPPPDAVRIEELINYFRVDYAAPRGDVPVAITTELGPCPWNSRHRLALVGIQARGEGSVTPRRNLVFLLDVSGSMAQPDKLPLVQTAMRMLADTLTARDRVAIVVYAGASGLALPSTPGDRKADIDRAIANLGAGGSTNGAAGIQLAYDTAASAFVPGGVNRVILATDGDFNVGATSQGDLVRLIEQQRQRGIFLSVLGVGTGNLQDQTMELLADRGNGHYAYLDSLQEARRVLIHEASSTLVTVAKDVKIQIEFNPATVGAYRLVGYENRVLDARDFNDDRKDGGEMGAGHTVTALYEIVPPGDALPGTGIDPLVYQRPPAAATGRSVGGELMTVKVRFKAPDGGASEMVSVAVRDAERAGGPAIGFAAAVAQFGMLLRDSPFKGEATWASTRALARASQGDDRDGYRAEFIRLVELAGALQKR